MPNDEFDKQFLQLDQQQMLQSMIVDNAGRARSGTFTYTVIWMVIGIGSGWYQQQPEWFIANLAFLVGFSVIRLWVLQSTAARAETHAQVARIVYLTVVLTNALHWGLVAAMGVYSEHWHIIEIPLLLSVAGVAAAGTATMAIDHHIRYLFPCFVLLPVVGALLLEFTASNAIVSVLCVVFAVYLTLASGSVHRDYWQALQAGLLLEKKAAEFHRLSITDTLTQINNRLYFDDYFAAEWRRTRRSKESIAVCLIDLDHFKQINDNHGHAFGDYCLQQTAEVLQQQMRRSGDVVARYGGEEFIVLLPNTDIVGAEQFANQLLQAISAVELLQGDHRAIVHASIGVAATGTDDKDAAHKLIHQADKALYQAKALGRNRVELFSSESGSANI